MKYIKLLESKIIKFENFLSEAIKFNLSNELDAIINGIQNKKKAQNLESIFVKSLLTDFLPALKRFNIILDKEFSNWNTQQKLDYLFKNPEIKALIDRRYTGKLVSIRDYLHTNNITSNNFEELYNNSRLWHEEIAKNVEIPKPDTKVIRRDETSETDKFITYPNGWYWINLNNSYSKDEADNMGHCGNDDGKILFSLRDNNSNSHITVSYEITDKALYQCKGRGNTKPKDIYHKYIIDLLLNDKYPFKLIMTGSYKPELDFNLLDLTDEERDELLTKNPSLEYTDSMFELYIDNSAYPKIVSMVENGFDYNAEKKLRDIEFLYYLIKQKVNIGNFIHNEWYSPSLDLNTTKEDLELYMKYCNSGVLETKWADKIYVLWKLGVITDADAEARIVDLKIKEGKWYYKYNHEKWGNFAFMFSDSSISSYGSKSYSEYVKQYADEGDRGNVEFSFKDCDFDYITKETIIIVLNHIIEENINLEENEIEELLESEYDYGFRTIEDFSFEKIKLVINNKSFKELLKLDSLKDIKRKIRRSYESAQEDADEADMHKAILRPIESFFNLEEYDWFEGNYLLLEFDPKWAILINKSTDNAYRLTKLEYIIDDLFDESFREDAINVYGVDSDEFPDFLEFKYPYNGFHGSIDKDNLNYLIEENLNY